MTHKPIIDYFEQINLKLIHFPETSFFRMDLMEITGAFRSGINFPALAVESPDGDAEGSSTNSSVSGRMFAFTVYHRPTRGNFQEQNELLDECERIGLKIVARMRHDARIPTHPLYNKFSAETAKWMKVGPIFNEELHGYRFTGMIKGEESLKIDAADWSDIDLTC